MTSFAEFAALWDAPTHDRHEHEERPTDLSRLAGRATGEERERIDAFLVRGIAAGDGMALRVGADLGGEGVLGALLARLPAEAGWGRVEIARGLAEHGRREEAERVLLDVLATAGSGVSYAAILLKYLASERTVEPVLQALEAEQVEDAYGHLADVLPRLGEHRTVRFMLGSTHPAIRRLGVAWWRRTRELRAAGQPWVRDPLDGPSEFVAGAVEWAHGRGQPPTLASAVPVGDRLLAEQVLLIALVDRADARVLPSLAEIGGELTAAYLRHEGAHAETLHAIERRLERNRAAGGGMTGYDVAWDPERRS